MHAPIDQMSALLLYFPPPKTYGAIFKGDPSIVVA